MRRLRVGVNLLYLKPGRVGGTEDYVERLIAALDRQAAADVELTLFVNRRFGAAHPQLAGSHETVVAPVSGDRPAVRIAVEATWLAREAARRPLDLVHHVANTVPHVVTRPAVVTIHDLQPLVRPQDFGRIKGAYLRRRLRPSARKARVVVTPSEYARGLVIDHFGVDPQRVVAVPMPLAPPADDGSADTGAGDKDVEPPYFLYPAITHPHKNHITLIRALAEVIESRPDVTLVLTGGEGANEAVVRSEIERLDLGSNVRRTGRIARPELDRLMRRATALTMPSEHEGYGLPVTEAMALDCPVIASNTTALPEVAGDAALLVEPHDVAGWSAAMASLLEDGSLRRRLIEAGRLRVASFTPVETARRLVAAYRFAAGNG